MTVQVPVDTFIYQEKTKLVCMMQSPRVKQVKCRISDFSN